MDRRTALKNLSIGLGYTVATPTILNILSSCTTDTPGALDVNVPQFIDMMYHDIERKGNQNLFKKGAKAFSKLFKSEFNTEVKDGKKVQFETLLTSLFNLSDEETETILNQQSQYSNTFTDSEKDKFMMYKFLISVRRYTLLGYFTSEKVGKEVLNYDPIPGEDLGCIPLEDVPNGRTWSYQRW